MPDSLESRFSSGPRKHRRPAIDAQTKLLAFDVETNGLHGAAFAVGAVVMQADGKVLSEFKDSAPVRGALDPWTKENVMPMLAGYPQNYKSAKALRGAFWQWYLDNEKSADYTVVTNGYPVEYRFLIQCQDDDIEGRFWDHPFPLLDLPSLLIQVGERPLVNKAEFVAEHLSEVPEQRHNPYWDAWVTALAAFKALRLSGQLKD